jgi:glycosyltransferase involved in cell wall biosynthesis
MDKTAPAVSVIVPVYNARDTIEKCLAAIRAQEGVGPGEVELIVVDDASIDGSAEAAEGKCDKLVRMEQNRGAAAARNRGAGQAAAEILVFVDADVILQPEALSVLLKLFRENPDIHAAVGRYTREPALPGLINEYHNAFTRYHHDLSPEVIDWFWGALGAVRKEAFNQAGGFDERYQGASAEDMELGLALARSGFKIVYCKEAEGAHAHKFSLSGMIENDFKKAVLGMKIKLLGRLPHRAPGFVNRYNLTVMISELLFIVIPLAPLPEWAEYIWLAAFLLMSVGGANFTRYLGKISEKGRLRLSHLFLYWLQMLVIMAGAAAGLLGWALGRDPYGRPGWI